MEINPLHQEVDKMRRSLLDEGFLDRQYVFLESLEDQDNPNFIEETIHLFFKQSTELFAEVEKALDSTAPLDFTMLDEYLHQFKGTSSSVGAKVLLKENNDMRQQLHERDIERAKLTFQQLKKDHELLRKKFDAYFQLRREAGPRECPEEFLKQMTC